MKVLIKIRNLIFVWFILRVDRLILIYLCSIVEAFAHKISYIFKDWEENEEEIVVEPDHNLSLSYTNIIENDSDSAEYAEPVLQTSQHSSNSQNKTLICEVCNKMFSKRSNYTRHIKIHLSIRRYPCSSCDKSFCSQQNLTIHNRVHTGEHPYECVLCTKSFAVQQNLSIHLRSHTGML